MRSVPFLLVAMTIPGCAAEIAERDPRADPASAQAEEAPPPPPIGLNEKIQSSPSLRRRKRRHASFDGEHG